MAAVGALINDGAMSVRPTIGSDQQRVREDAIIARAIAEHEMRNP